MESLDVAARAGDSNASAYIEVGIAGIGELSMVLEDDDGQVWWDDTSGVSGINTLITEVENLETGNYTLTASIEIGARFVTSLQLAIAWGGEVC